MGKCEHIPQRDISWPYHLSNCNGFAHYKTRESEKDVGISDPFIHSTNVYRVFMYFVPSTIILAGNIGVNKV